MFLCKATARTWGAYSELCWNPCVHLCFQNISHSHSRSEHNHHTEHPCSTFQPRKQRQVVLMKPLTIWKQHSLMRHSEAVTTFTLQCSPPVASSPSCQAQLHQLFPSCSLCQPSPRAQAEGCACTKDAQLPPGCVLLWLQSIWHLNQTISSSMDSLQRQSKAFMRLICSQAAGQQVPLMFSLLFPSLGSTTIT